MTAQPTLPGLEPAEPTDVAAGLLGADRDGLLDVLGEVFPDPAARTLSFVFEAMGWAEDAIAEASERHPDSAHLLDAAFRALQPNWDLFRGRGSEHVVRAHMDELLRRVAEDGTDADLEPGTAAEGVVAMMELNLARPSKHYAYVGTTALFLDAFGREKAEEVFGEEFVRRAEEDRESHHLVGEFLGKVRHETRDEARQTIWREKVET